MPPSSRPSKPSKQTRALPLNAGAMPVSDMDKPHSNAAPAHGRANDPSLDNSESPGSPNTKPAPSTDVSGAPGNEQDDASNAVIRGLASLNVHLPNDALMKVAANCHGLTPMERFLQEACGPLEKLVKVSCEPKDKKP